MAPKKILKIMSFDEVDEKLKRGLCFLCDEPSTMEHQLIHNPVVLMNMVEEEPEHAEPSNLSITTAAPISTSLQGTVADFDGSTNGTHHTLISTPDHFEAAMDFYQNSSVPVSCDLTSNLFDLPMSCDYSIHEFTDEQVDERVEGAKAIVQVTPSPKIPIGANFTPYVIYGSQLIYLPLFTLSDLIHFSWYGLVPFTESEPNFFPPPEPPDRRLLTTSTVEQLTPPNNVLLPPPPEPPDQICGRIAVKFQVTWEPTLLFSPLEVDVQNEVSIFYSICSCGVELGFSCQNLLIRVEAAEDSAARIEIGKVRDSELLGRVVRSLARTTQGSAKCISDFLDSLYSCFPLSYDVHVKSCEPSSEDWECLEEDIWVVARLVHGLSTSISAVYIAGELEDEVGDIAALYAAVPDMTVNRKNSSELQTVADIATSIRAEPLIDGVVIWRYDSETNVGLIESSTINPRYLYALATCGNFAFVVGVLDMSNYMNKMCSVPGIHTLASIMNFCSLELLSFGKSTNFVRWHINKNTHRIVTALDDAQSYNTTFNGVVTTLPVDWLEPLISVCKLQEFLQKLIVYTLATGLKVTLLESFILSVIVHIDLVILVYLIYMDRSKLSRQVLINLLNCWKQTLANCCDSCQDLIQAALIIETPHICDTFDAWRSHENLLICIYAYDFIKNTHGGGHWNVSYTNLDQENDLASLCEWLNVVLLNPKQAKEVLGHDDLLVHHLNLNRYPSNLGGAVSVVTGSVSIQFEYIENIVSTFGSQESKQARLHIVTGRPIVNDIANCCEFEFDPLLVHGKNAETVLRNQLGKLFGSTIVVGIGFNTTSYSLLLNVVRVVALLSPKRSRLVNQFAFVAIFHRKMIYKGNVRAAKVLVKWKTLPLKHGTWNYSSLRTRMFSWRGYCYGFSIDNVTSFSF